jgi:hypothetical protein
LENRRDFCCLDVKKVLSLLYTPSRTAYGTDLVKKSVGIGIGNDRSELPDRAVKRTSGDKRSNERLAPLDSDHSATINLGKARFRTSLATTPRREVGLQEICRICGSGHYRGIVRTKSNEQPNYQDNDDAQCGGDFERHSFRAQLGRVSAVGILGQRSGDSSSRDSSNPCGSEMQLNLEARVCSTEACRVDCR